MKKRKLLLSFCGLDCSQCAAYIATINDDDDLRQKTAKDWTKRYHKNHPQRPALQPEDINCRGCLSAGPIYLYCRKCQIRKCALKRKIKNCKECGNYKCEQLVELQKHLF